MIDLSVIILNYNKNQLALELVKLLYSKELQPSTEFIFIDNASTGQEDLRHQLEQPWGDQTNFQAFFLEENRGPSAGRNFGAQKANGKYLQFIDSDDWIHPEKINLQWQFALENNHPVLVASPWARVPFHASEGQLEMLSLHTPDFSEPLVLSLISPTGFVHLSSIIVRRDAFLEMGGFHEDAWLIEDVEMLLNLAIQENSFAVCPSDFPLSFYRVNAPGSLSQSNPVQFNLRVLSNGEKAFHFLRERNIPASSREQSIFGDIVKNALTDGFRYRSRKLITATLNLQKEVGYSLQYHLSGWKNWLKPLSGINFVCQLEALILRSKDRLKSFLGYKS